MDGKSPPILPVARRLRPSVASALPVWLRVALLSFGGPAGQIAVMHRILVEEKRWISESRFLARTQLLHAVARPRSTAACNLYRLADARDARRHCRRRPFHSSGRRRHHGAELRLRGMGPCPDRAALFFGLKAAVLAIVLEARASDRQARSQESRDDRDCGGRFHRIFFFAVPFPIIILRRGRHRLCRERLPA